MKDERMKTIIATHERATFKADKASIERRKAERKAAKLARRQGRAS
ncbi:hypothetical protein UFOVP1360_28 [uncultured Caudovirales phage]|uniref:Uncharacterized protein n=1 Tax=uncultured Caudovirales phage TaxID=2100421 RepID=A0A6J5RYE5_9CAUD|nr:hypothetical protein UFOVP1360_28 [uncultured Caudovirales phage]